MKAHDPTHRQTWDLIPWLVNDTLDDDQREAVEAHLRECADCREELAFQRSVHAGILKDAPTVAAVSPVTMARFFERIDAEDEALPSGPRLRSARSRPHATRADSGNEVVAVCALPICSRRQ